MATRFADHLLEGDHASRPAAGDVPAGTLYSCSDHDLVYQSDGSSSWSTWATVGGGGSVTNLESARYTRSSGNYTITGAGSDSFADVDGTNLSFTKTTGARRVLIVVQANASSNNAGGTVMLDVTVDGTRQGGTTGGLVFSQQHSTVSEAMNVSFSYVTDVLSAASHTFKLQWRQGSTGHTATLYASDPTLSMAVVELLAD